MRGEGIGLLTLCLEHQGRPRIFRQSGALRGPQEGDSRPAGVAPHVGDDEIREGLSMTVMREIAQQLSVKGRVAGIGTVW